MVQAVLQQRDCNAPPLNKQEWQAAHANSDQVRQQAAAELIAQHANAAARILSETVEINAAHKLICIYPILRSGESNVENWAGTVRLLFIL